MAYSANTAGVPVPPVYPVWSFVTLMLPGLVVLSPACTLSSSGEHFRNVDATRSKSRGPGLVWSLGVLFSKLPDDSNVLPLPGPRALALVN